MGAPFSPALFPRRLRDGQGPDFENIAFFISPFSSTPLPAPAGPHLLGDLTDWSGSALRDESCGSPFDPIGHPQVPCARWPGGRTAAGRTADRRYSGTAAACR